MLGKLLPCLLLSLLCFYSTVLSWPSLENQHRKFSQPQHYEGSSDLVNLVYHMGPVLTSPVNLYIIWYGHWNPTQQSILMDFLLSLSSYSLSFPSVANWWQTARLYTDQTGANVTGNIVLAGAHSDSGYSQGRYLSRLAIQSVIKAATIAYPQALPVDPENGLYLVLTSTDVRVEDFCRAVCGFHYFTFPSIVGMTVPYAWVGYSGDQCPEMCAFPFAMPKYGGRSTRSSTTTTSTQESSNEAMGSPNGDIGADGMVSVIAHELAEMATNPLINAWYAGDDPTAPDEIADMCVGVYGSGGGGGYVGMVSRDSQGRGFNVNGVRGRKFLVQWVWNPIRGSCYGPNALD